MFAPRTRTHEEDRLVFRQCVDVTGSFLRFPCRVGESLWLLHPRPLSPPESTCGCQGWLLFLPRASHTKYLPPLSAGTMSHLPFLFSTSYLLSSAL